MSGLAHDSTLQSCLELILQRTAFQVLGLLQRSTQSPLGGVACSHCTAPYNQVQQSHKAA